MQILKWHFFVGSVALKSQNIVVTHPLNINELDTVVIRTFVLRPLNPFGTFTGSLFKK